MHLHDASWLPAELTKLVPTPVESLFSSTSWLPAEPRSLIIRKLDSSIWNVLVLGFKSIIFDRTVEVSLRSIRTNSH